MLESQLQTKWVTKLRTIPGLWLMKATVTNLSGAPDTVLCYKSRFIAIEFKIYPNKLSPKQEHEKKKLEAAGALYLVVDQFTDYKETLKTLHIWTS